MFIAEDDPTNFRSQARVRRSVTPLRSGPTSIPFTKVWQAVQRFLKIALAPVETATASREMARETATSQRTVLA